MHTSLFVKSQKLVITTVFNLVKTTLLNNHKEYAADNTTVKELG